MAANTHTVGAVVALSLALAASAQEAALSLAATQPAKSRIGWREQARFERYELGSETIDQWTLDTRLVYGVDGDLSLTLNIPAIVRDRGAEPPGDRDGLGDITLTLKHRFWQHDPGPIDTNRLALVAGARLPSGTHELSSGGVDPFLGLTFTRVSGRHGLNASALYTLTTDGRAAPILAGQGVADLFTLETSYIFRLSPRRYTSETVASLYLSAESFLDIETNGDTSWRLAPGLLYEARRFTLELSPILPIAQDVSGRAELEWGVAFGFRVLF